MTWRVLGCRGCGSAIVEAALTLAGIAYEREEVNYDSAEGRARLLELNPLAQVPTALPDTPRLDARSRQSSHSSQRETTSYVVERS